VRDRDYGVEPHEHKTRACIVVHIHVDEIMELFAARELTVRG
jgi:hypothetical protein